MPHTQVSIPRREIRLTKTKTSSPRVVPLSDAAIRTLIGTPRHITSPYVFWHGDGRRFTTFTNIFALIARRAGVPFRCDDLRHGFASRFPQATGNIPAVQAILGHRPIQMTMGYAHIRVRSSCSQITLADQRRQLASDGHFQPAADRIQNHVPSGTACPLVGGDSGRVVVGTVRVDSMVAPFLGDVDDPSTDDRHRRGKIRTDAPLSRG